MRLLIDTHVFLWWDAEPRRIVPPLLASIRDEEAEIFVSAASVWEIAIKRATGSLVFRGPVASAIGAHGFRLLPITAEHAEHAGGLPRHHRDPFDRMLVAQATLERLLLGTQDPRIEPYGVATLGLSRGQGR